jgi:cytochrome c oxidase assembly protein subunit 15
VLSLSLVAVGHRRSLLALLLAAALCAALGVMFYIKGAYATSAMLSSIAIALPLVAASKLDRSGPWRVAVVALAVVIFQAMLGMWTVTLLLKPIVVMGHLLGGLLTFSLLGYVALRLADRHVPTPPQQRLKAVVVVALVLLALQIAFGGWTSANYAALACGADFPQCAGSWWPDPDFREGFVLWRGIGVSYEGGVLDIAARAAIQIAHRIGALIVFGHVLATAVLAWRRGLRTHSVLVGVLLCAQIALGIANVKLLLPLPVATLHNAGAALLLMSLIALLARIQMPLAATERRIGEAAVRPAH